MAITRPGGMRGVLAGSVSYVLVAAVLMRPMMAIRDTEGSGDFLRLLLAAVFSKRTPIGLSFFFLQAFYNVQL